ncbi:beta-lactamase-like protein [Xylariales sp. PMI_506]|nr:beta-lactamase-like protein [Xylariales sp. PMI_506]
MAKKAVFNIPTGASARVHIIDTQFRMSNMAVNYLLTPGVDGFETLPPLAAWSFLVESARGQKVLFDLSFPPNPAAYPPATLELIKGANVTMEGDKHVADVLKANNVDPSEISSVIWSHYHFDHIGDVTTFPKTTELVVGPGFKDAYLPGYPSQPDTWLEERHFEGRTLREINFTEQKKPLTIGAFRAFDFFGDGSFYLLDTPGHTIGHLAGLARTTTSPDTFIFMGGDVCHHGGEIRPSQYLSIPPSVQFPASDPAWARASVCPGAAQFHALNIRRGRKPDEPFFDPVLVVDMDKAVRTIRDSQAADAHSDVFFIFAHDMEIERVVDFFPKPANDWKEKGWKEKTQWNFLADLTAAANASK